MHIARAPLSGTRASRGRDEGGFTFIEVAVAAGLVVTVVGALFLANSRVLEMLAFHKETIAATQSFQERMEKIRSTGFTDLATPNYVRDNILNADPLSAATLAGSVETVTVSAYPDDGSTPTVEVRQNGTTNISSANDTLASGTLVRVDLQLTWKSSDGRTRLRRTSTVIGKGNIAL